MAIRKMNVFGTILVDDEGHIIIKTKNGNLFTVDQASDLTTIEAKDMLIGEKRKVYDEDEDSDESTYYSSAKQSTDDDTYYAKKMSVDKTSSPKRFSVKGITDTKYGN